jgi:thiosulfate/3-mercaptopyruvate sulfurtransferase
MLLRIFNKEWKEYDMSNVFRYCIFITTVACLLLVSPLTAAEGVKGNLVDVNWLNKHFNDSEVLILDASFPQAYAAKHIPGAVNVNIITYGIQEIPITEMGKIYQSWGISSDKKIVIYDQGAGMTATRVFFNLYYHGFPAKNLFVLDGGLAKWEENGLPVTKDVTPGAKQGNFKIKKIDENVRVKLPEFLAASGDLVNNVFLEALGANWHFGEVAFFDRPGHIPYGILLPSEDFYNPDKTFKSADEIKKMMDYLGVKPEQQVYTYCGGGVAASVPFFALKFILNYPRVKLYKESEMGWLKDERGLPYWTYDAPFLMKQSNWLKLWGGKMIRMYGGSQVSILDVRHADAYKLGHIPFALNIPIDVFKSNITHPDKLAEILGPAGIDKSHEAVVVSGAGINKDSALAFLLLEKMGQKKISILMDPGDKWEQLGFEVTKDATVIGPKKNPMDLSIPATAYPGNFLKDVIISDPKSTQGLYPKVFIASGKDIPAKSLYGTVVHVPYTDLLNDDGTPKAAKDIWNILVKAGVPRYAELVCFSEDPGEAAINYFILKLMGYPDIKVLLI